MNRRIFAEALENDCKTDDLTAVVDMRDRLYGLKRSVMTECDISEQRSPSQLLNNNAVVVGI